MFKDNLKAFRMQRGYTQRRFANLLGVNQSTVGNWESGAREPGLRKLQEIAGLLSVSADMLLGLCPPESSTKTRFFPVYGYEAFPEGIRQVVLGHEVYTPTDDASYFVLQIGDTFMEPRLSQGDLAIVRCQNQVPFGQLTVIRLKSGEVLCRQMLHIDGNIVFITPDKEKPFLFFPESHPRESYVVLGQVVEIRKRC